MAKEKKKKDLAGNHVYAVLRGGALCIISLLFIVANHIKHTILFSAFMQDKTSCHL
jgi:hypothetical protein